MGADSILLWRHGLTDFNAQGRIQGSSDIPLNEVGHGQARLVAPHIAAIKPGRIICSPLIRARQTAAEVTRLVGVDAHVDPRLTERNFGEWEGLTREEIAARDPEQSAVWRAGGQPEGVGVETKQSVGARVVAAIEEASGQMNGGRLLVVAHGAAIACGLAVLMETDAEWNGLGGLENCHWVYVSRQDNRTPRWRLEGYNRWMAKATDPVRNLEVD